MISATVSSKSVGIVWEMYLSEKVLRPPSKMEKSTTEGEGSEMQFKALEKLVSIH